MSDEKTTKRRRPQPTVVYTEVVPTMTQKSGSECPDPAAVPSPLYANDERTEPRSHPEDDTVMYAQVKRFVITIYTVGHKKRATLFWTITPAFLDRFQHFVHL